MTAVSPDAESNLDSLRERVLAAAITLLTEQGRDALTTRSVAAAAGLQPPALYRLFGDKRRLLDAVAVHGYAAYMQEKQAQALSDDPVENLRRGWDVHIEFGLTHPALYTLMGGDPRPDAPSLLDATGLDILRDKLRVMARAGRLKVSVERAALFMLSASTGVILTLLSQPEDQRDADLSTFARESVLAATLTDLSPLPRENSVAEAAVTLQARLPESGPLSPGERSLLTEWLGRLSGLSTA